MEVPCAKKVQEQADTDARDEEEFRAALVAQQRANKKETGKNTAVLTNDNIQAMEIDCTTAQDNCDVFNKHSVTWAHALYQTAYNAVVLKTKGTDLKGNLCEIQDYQLYNGVVYQEVIEQIYHLTNKHESSLLESLSNYLAQPKKRSTKIALMRCVMEAIVNKYNLG